MSSASRGLKSRFKLRVLRALYQRAERFAQPERTPGESKNLNSSIMHLFLPGGLERVLSAQTAQLIDGVCSLSRRSVSTVEAQLIIHQRF
eukprot:1775634-Prymnesium_polylepis.1